jgi:Nuclease-related domain
LEAHTRTSRAGLGDDVRRGIRHKLAALLTSGARNGAGATARRNGTDVTELKFEEHLGPSSAVVLHHRRLPGSGGEISHLIIGPAGITVVDARNYASRRARVGRGGLRVGRRNRSDLIEAVLREAESLRSVLTGTPYSNVPVEAALAWREVEGLPILHSFNAPRVMVCGVGKIAREASRPGPLSRRRVSALASYLDGQLPR